VAPFITHAVFDENAFRRDHVDSQAREDFYTKSDLFQGDLILVSCLLGLIMLGLQKARSKSGILFLVPVLLAGFLFGHPFYYAGNYYTRTHLPCCHEELSGFRRMTSDCPPVQCVPCDKGGQALPGKAPEWWRY
jgi:hypothetical protein